jgi:hypothetical protein
VVDRARFQAELDALRVREKAHTQQRDGLVALFFWIGIPAFCRLASVGSAKRLGFVFHAISGGYQGFGNRYQGCSGIHHPTIPESYQLAEGDMTYVTGNLLHRNLF